MERFVAGLTTTKMEGLMKSARRLVGATWLATWTAIAAPALGQELQNTL